MSTVERSEPAAAAAREPFERGVFIAGVAEPVEGAGHTIRDPGSGAVVGRVTAAGPEIAHAPRAKPGVRRAAGRPP